MSFKPGHAKKGGRAKGAKNKKTQTLEEIFEAANMNIPERLLEIIESPELKDKDRGFILLNLMDYIYPKRKATEITHKGEIKTEVEYNAKWGDAGEGSQDKEDS